MDKIASAFVKAQAAFAPALKTNTNPHFKSRYVGLDGCIEAVIDALNSNGIALMQPTRDCEKGVTVETIFVHESGQTMSGGVLHVPAAKEDPQGYGSALTYARRYSLMAACGIAPEDDDGNAASRSRETPAQKAERERKLARGSELDQLAAYLIEMHENESDLKAIELWNDPQTWAKDSGEANEEKLYVWEQLKPFSKLRSAIKANKPA